MKKHQENDWTVERRQLESEREGILPSAIAMLSLPSCFFWKSTLLNQFADA